MNAEEEIDLSLKRNHGPGGVLRTHLQDMNTAYLESINDGMHSISSNAKLTNGRNPQDDLANKSVVNLNLNVDTA